MAGGDFEIPPPPGDTSPPGSGGSGTSSGGSSSGGSSSGSSSSGSSSSGSSSTAESSLTPRQEELQKLRERVDPYDLWYEGLSKREQKSVSILDQIYAEVWGEPAPLAVLQAAVKQGLNRWEFAEAMKRNPAWWKSDAAEDEALTFYNFLAQLGIAKRQIKRRGNRGNGGGQGGGGGGGKNQPPPGGGPPGGGGGGGRNNPPGGNVRYIGPPEERP